jgi:outer membrane lipoprotein-sorting protein
VSELAELLELMHGATGRVESVHAVLVERQRPELLRLAFRRFGERVQFARGGGYFHVAAGGVAAGEQADEHHWRVELWAEQGRSRLERTGPDVESVLVIDGEKWWSWTPPFGLDSFEGQPGVTHHQAGLDRLDPSPFLAGYQLELAGQASIAGRGARRVRVRANAQDAARHHHLQHGVEEAELLLDAERGLILRKAELVDGQEAAVTEVEEIAYDLAIPAERFLFELPAGASGKNLREPQATTVDQVAILASFIVFKLPAVPPGWRVQAFYIPPVERPTLPEMVTLLYSRDDAAQTLRLQQQTVEHEPPAIGGERRFEQGGRSYVALGPERPQGLEPGELLFALEGTHIRMTSSQLSRVQLLEHAGQLTAA